IKATTGSGESIRSMRRSIACSLSSMPPFITQHGTEEPADWQAFAWARGTFYHDARWISGLAGGLRYRTHWITATGPEGVAGAMAVAEVPKLAGGKTLVSYPFSFIAGPMATSTEAAQAVLQCARELVREVGSKRLEVKALGPGFPVASGFQRSERYTTY